MPASRTACQSERILWRRAWNLPVGVLVLPGSLGMLSRLDWKDISGGRMFTKSLT